MRKTQGILHDNLEMAGVFIPRNSSKYSTVSNKCSRPFYSLQCYKQASCLYQGYITQHDQFLINYF